MLAERKHFEFCCNNFSVRAIAADFLCAFVQKHFKASSKYLLNQILKLKFQKFDET